MDTLPNREKPIPPGLTIEKEARNLASLSLTPSLRMITNQVITQWKKRLVFSELEKFGIYPSNKLFFYGPPGNGKTTAAQYISKQLDAPLYRVAAESLVVSLFGGTARSIGEVMTWLSKQGRAVVLFDEIETLFPSRESNKSSCASESNSAMATFWQHLDRWTSPQLFILATNMEERVDPAIISRFEIKLKFEGPNADQCREVINYWSEMLHKYGADEWKPKLLDQIEQDGPFESFRDLWNRVKWEVTSFVNKQK